MSDWQGLSYQEVKEKFSDDYSCWQETPHLFTLDRSCFPVLELFQQAQQFWQEILNKHRGQTILIVAHGGTNRALISTAIGLNPEHYHSLQQSNCGISCLEFSSINGSCGQLKYLNSTNHLGENLPKLKAGKTGWRWLLLSDRVTENLLKYSCLPGFIHQDLINLILTDNSQKSESLAIELLKNSNKVIHLPMAQDHFLEVWQQTIFARQKLNYCSVEASLVTGLIIVQENLFCQILQKTLGITIPLETANHLSVIHYPQANRQSILQALLPIDRQLVTQLSKDKICIA
jgi:probable phosphoglycerate mutase